MKPFDLEAAKTGAPVETRNGKPARIVCFDAAGPEPLVVLLKNEDEDSERFGFEECWQYSADGTFNLNAEFTRSSLDLVMQ